MEKKLPKIQQNTNLQKNTSPKENKQTIYVHKVSNSKIPTFAKIIKQSFMIKKYFRSREFSFVLAAFLYSFYSRFFSQVFSSLFLLMG